MSGQHIPAIEEARAQPKLLYSWIGSQADNGKQFLSIWIRRNCNHGIIAAQAMAKLVAIISLIMLPFR